jgi:hypothetical protein
MKYNKLNYENYCIVIHLEQDAFYECRDRDYTIKDKVFCTLSNDWMSGMAGVVLCVEVNISVVVNFA